MAAGEDDPPPAPPARLVYDFKNYDVGDPVEVDCVDVLERAVTAALAEASHEAGRRYEEAVLESLRAAFGAFAGEGVWELERERREGAAGRGSRLLLTWAVSGSDEAFWGDEFPVRLVAAPGDWLVAAGKRALLLGADGAAERAMLLRVASELRAAAAGIERLVADAGAAEEGAG